MPCLHGDITMAYAVYGPIASSDGLSLSGLDSVNYYHYEALIVLIIIATGAPWCPSRRPR